MHAELPQASSSGLIGTQAKQRTGGGPPAGGPRLHVLTRANLYPAVVATVAVDPASFAMGARQALSRLRKQAASPAGLDNAQITLGNGGRDEVSTETVVGNTAVAQQVPAVSRNNEEPSVLSESDHRGYGRSAACRLERSPDPD